MRKKVISNQENKTRDELISGKSFGRAAVIAMSLALCTVTSLTLTACGSSSDAKGPGGMRPGIASGGAAGFDGEDGAGNGERPDFKDGEMPQPPDGERPDFANGERPEGAPEGEPPDGERPDFADGERPEGAPDGGPSGGEMPDRPNGEDAEEA